MWGFCYPAELPSLVQIAWIPSFCSQNLTKPLPETQRYKRERANESRNLSRGYLYSFWNVAISASLSPIWSPCCPLLVHPLKQFLDRDLQLLLISDPVLLPAKDNRMKYHISLAPAKYSFQWGSHIQTRVQSTASQVQDILLPSCGILSSLHVPAVIADIPACICGRHPQIHGHARTLW